MAIYKNKDLEVDISFGTSKQTNKGASFYTGDKGSTSIRITVKHKGFPFNFAESDMIPTLDLIHSDGSIWLSEPMTMIADDKGVIEYNIPNNIIEHAGTISAKLFLKNADISVHALNFNIEILDSGIEGLVEKELNLVLVEEIVTNIVQENALGLLDETFKTEVLDSFETYTMAHPELFKGEKGDKGDKGLRGETGLQGVKGDTGAAGQNGQDGAQGEKGPRGYQGIQGERGSAGKSVYDIAVDNGFVGNESQWLSSINNNSVYLDDYGVDKNGNEPVGETIQNVLNLMETTNIRNLFINDGTYLINRRLYIPRNTNIIMNDKTVLLRGHNGGFFDNGDPNANVGLYNGAGNIKVIGGTLDNNYENLATYPTNQINMVSLRHGRNIEFKNVKFRNSLTVHVMDVNGTENFKVEDCVFEGYANLTGVSDKEAIQLSEYVTGGINGGIFDGTPTQKVTIKNNVFKSSDVLPGFDVCVGNHLSAHDVFNNDINIYNNKFEDVKIGVRIWKWRDVNIHDNTFNNVNECLRVSSIGASYSSANKVDGTPSNTSQASSNIIFKNNRVYGFSTTAIGVYGIEDNNVAYVENLTIEGNIIKAKTTGVGAAIVISITNHTNILNNTISNCYRSINYEISNNLNIDGNNIINSKVESIFNNSKTGTSNQSYNVMINRNTIDTSGKNGMYINSSDTARIVDNIVSNSNNDVIGGSYRGGIYVQNSNRVAIENNTIFSANDDFSVRINNSNNTNIFNTKGNSKIMISGGTNSGIGYFGYDSTGESIILKNP